MPRNKTLLLAAAFLIFFASACSAQPTQASPTPRILPTLTAVAKLPASEAEIQRVPPQDAKKAFDAGTAIIVDVRSRQAFEASHVTGAVSIPLADIEANPGAVTLPKDQWIIFYCT